MVSSVQIGITLDEGEIQALKALGGTVQGHIVRAIEAFAEDSGNLPGASLGSGRIVTCDIPRPTYRALLPMFGLMSPFREAVRQYLRKDSAQ
jgi:hypothetical protein